MNSDDVSVGLHVRWIEQTETMFRNSIAGHFSIRLSSGIFETSWRYDNNNLNNNINTVYF